MKALFIGRFQPFHCGHLEVIKLLCKEYEKVIIGIGSSQYKEMMDNPFSFDERKTMIQAALELEKIRNIQIHAIPDIHDPPNWVAHVESLIDDFDIVITNNSFTTNLFREKGYLVKGTKIFQRDMYSGKEIRRRIIYDESWEHLVPQQIANFIHKINGVSRIKKFGSE